ncbi:hypothetical protein FRC12_004017 [Ceratobasidium sp. 428]|nr:hypothetical protein FRC12_004017 [Ceratobasidium sp. 428]
MLTRSRYTPGPVARTAATTAVRLTSPPVALDPREADVLAGRHARTLGHPDAAP